MRVVCFGALLLVTAILAFADQQTTLRPLTPADAAALSEAVALGERITRTLAHYFEVTHPPMRIRGDTGLITRTPTIHVLRAVRYLSDADFQLARRYYAALHPMPSEAPATQPLLTMQTDRGVLVFQVSGEVALEPSK